MIAALTVDYYPQGSLRGENIEVSSRMIGMQEFYTTAVNLWVSARAGNRSRSTFRIERERYTINFHGSSKTRRFN